MCRRPLAGFFSRMCTGTPMVGLSELSGLCTDTTMWMSLLQPDRETLLPVPCVWACLEGRTTSQ